MANWRMYSQQDRLSLLVITPEGPYVIDVLKDQRGAVSSYYIFEPSDPHPIPVILARHLEGLSLYDPESDTWDAAAVDVMLARWAEMRMKKG